MRELWSVKKITQMSPRPSPAPILTAEMPSCFGTLWPRAQLPEITFALSHSVTNSGLELPNDQVVVPERQDNIHLAVVRLISSIRYGLPQCTCGSELSAIG